MPIWLAPAFFLTALLYASVGFGGRSTYNALLALAGVDYRVLPAVAWLFWVGYGAFTKRAPCRGAVPRCWRSWRRLLPGQVA